MKQPRHRGSALLIVLGMLSFMIVSAVAFSALMRTSRLPSSYLRRVVSSRLLVKAAMAEAIDEIDAAVGNFPHPGVWTAEDLGDSKNRQTDAGSALCRVENSEDPEASSPIVSKRGRVNANVWLGRVYIGNTNQTQSSDGKALKDAQQCLLPQVETIPTLTLEGLAYIPPPLVNEARYYSRHSNAATWHMLPFDAGRYAFTAIDVSDYFDINSIQADVPRDSSPEGRLSLAYLFENAAHASSSSDGTAWDTFIKQFQSKVPLISLADLNLAMGSSGATYNNKIKSYFWNYVKNGGSDFYSGEAAADPDKELISRMAFVTDGWFPPEDTSKDNRGNDLSDDKRIYDLSDEQYQPWPEGDLRSVSPDFFTVTDSSSRGVKRLSNFVPNIALAALYDYLDFDSVPISLGVPTTEQVPMICGIEPQVSGGVSIKGDPKNGDITWNPDLSTLSSATPAGQVFHATRVVKYYVEFDQSTRLGSNLIVAYPFHKTDGPSAQYDLQGRISLFFTTDQMALRPGAAVPQLQFANDPQAQNVYQDGIMSFPCTGGGRIQYNKGPNTAEQALKDSSEQMILDAAPSAISAVAQQLQQNLVFEVQYEWDALAVPSPTPGGTPTLSCTTLSAARNDSTANLKMSVVSGKNTPCQLTLLDKNGKIDSAFSSLSADAIDTLAQQGFAMKLNFAIWAGIKNQDGKYVDLVPACVQDDNLNGSPNWNNPQSHIILQDYYGAPTPLMRFDTGVSLTFQIDADANLSGSGASPAAITIAPKAVMVDDPRFNYAPESWFEYTAGGISKQVWLNENTAKNNDGDIFMQVSDQGHLQSPYELANIIRFGKKGFSAFGDPEIGGLVVPKNYTAFAPHGSEANHDFMWRTYDPFGRYVESDLAQQRRTGNQVKNYQDEQRVYPGDGFEALGFTSGNGGPRVNPYSDSITTLMAAFANTPHDWRCASPRNDTLPADAKSFNQKYAWNAYSSSGGGKLKWDGVLSEIVADFMDLVRDVGQDPASYEFSDAKLSAYCLIENNSLYDTNYRLTPAKKSYINGLWKCAFDRLDWTESRNGVSADDRKWHLCGTALDNNEEHHIYNTDKKFLYGYWRECFDVKQQLFLVFVRVEPMFMGGGAVEKTPPQLGARAMALVWRDPIDRDAQGQTYPKPHRTRVLFYRQFE